MTPFYIFLILLIQSLLSCAQLNKTEDQSCEIKEILQNKPEDSYEVVKDGNGGKNEWMDMFVGSNSNFYPGSSAAAMAQVINSDKTPEEQLEDMKDMENKITLEIQREIADLLSYALSNCDKEGEDNTLRKKRSIETPMDSTQLVMRLLKHIKCNNEFQNIAIEKMMTAQEIADKYGIEYHPDIEILSDLADAANKQAKELNSMYKEACNAKNITEEHVTFVPLVREERSNMKKSDKTGNSPYYVYSIYCPEQEIVQQHTRPHHEYVPEQACNIPSTIDHYHYSSPHYHYNYPYETQIPPPAQQHVCSPPVSQRPNFYDPVPVTPAQEYYPPYCSMESASPVSTILLPYEEPVPEPQIVGEEFEEAVSSKVFIDRYEEPGMATVNHVTTYTLSEKAHFKTPQVEKLPQQMQYCFFLQ